MIDASALVNAILDPSARRKLADLVEGESLAAPDLIDGEVLSAARAHARRGTLSERAAHGVITLATACPIRRVPCGALVDGAWAYRERLSAYDALYAALAARLDATLITDDLRLARGCRGVVSTTTLRS